MSRLQGADRERRSAMRASDPCAPSSEDEMKSRCRRSRKSIAHCQLQPSMCMYIGLFMRGAGLARLACFNQRNDWSQQRVVDPSPTRRTRVLLPDSRSKVPSGIDNSDHHFPSHQHHDEFQSQHRHQHVGFYLLECAGWHLHCRHTPRK